MSSPSPPRSSSPFGRGTRQPRRNWRSQETWIELLKEYALHDTEAPRYRLARDLLHRAEITAADAPFKLLVRLGLWDEDENLLVLRLGVPTIFRAEALQEAHAAAR